MVKINDTFDEHEEDQYARARRSVMSDDQMKLANKIQDWHRAAYWDKDNRGIFEKMETAELYWEGDANPPESDNDPASNTNIVNSTIEGQVTYLIEQNIAIEVKARKPSSLPFKKKAQSLLEWCKDQNKMRRKLDVHERRRKKFGVGVFRVLFDPDRLDGLGLPWIEPVNPAYLLVDPVVTDIYRVQEGRYIIEPINRSIESAREQFGDELADAITPGYVPLEFSDPFDEFGDEFHEGEIAREHYQHWLVWTHAWVPENWPESNEETDTDADEDSEPKEKKKVLRLIEMSACGVVLRDTLADGVLICESDNRYPYFFTPDMYREGTVWAKSTAELLIPVQDLIDDIDDQIRINARLTGNPQREVDVNSGVDPDKMSNEPGLIYPVQERGGITFLKPPEIPQYIQQRRAVAFQEAPIVSRWSFQMAGIKQDGVDTATESLSLQQGGTQGVTRDKMLLEETLSEVFEYCLILMLENYTETEIFRITEDGKDTFMALNPSEMREVPMLLPATEAYQRQFAAEFPSALNVPEWMPHPEGIKEKIALDIHVTVGAGLPANKAFVFQMIERARQAGVITPPEHRELLREYAGLPVPEQPEQPPAPAPVPGVVPPGAGPMPSPNVTGLTPQGVPIPPQPGGIGV